MGDLRDKTIKGLFWGGLDIFSSKGLSFLFNLLIARQLSPRDYGVIAILAVMMAICQCFVDSGFGAALVRKCKCSETDFSTIFYFNIFAALIIMMQRNMAGFLRTACICRPHQDLFVGTHNQCSGYCSKLKANNRGKFQGLCQDIYHFSYNIGKCGTVHGIQGVRNLVSGRSGLD